MFLFKWIRSLQHLQDQLSVLLNGVCFIRLQVAFVFPVLPPLFLQRLRFLNQVSFYSCEVSPFFSFIFLPGDSHEDSNGASSLSFFVLFSSPADSIRVFGVDHILFRISMFSHAVAPHNHSPLAIQLFRSAQDISKICVSTCIRSSLSRLLSYSSHLIQPMLSPFQVIVQWCFLLSGP